MFAVMMFVVMVLLWWIFVAVAMVVMMIKMAIVVMVAAHGLAAVAVAIVVVVVVVGVYCGNVGQPSQMHYRHLVVFPSQDVAVLLRCRYVHRRRCLAKTSLIL